MYQNKERQIERARKPAVEIPVKRRYACTYKKVVVPQSMRSRYWKYFGFPANEDKVIVSREKIICKLCNLQMCYNRNTSNLRHHLYNRHRPQLIELESTMLKRPKVIPPLKRKPLIMPKNNLFAETSEGGTLILDGETENVDLFLDHSNIELVEEAGLGNDNIVQSSSASDAIARFIIMDLVSPDIVEGPGFYNLIGTLCSPCEIPTKTKLEEEMLPKMYDIVRENVVNTFSTELDYMSLAIEEWKSNSEKFITFSVNYQQHFQEPNLETRVLRTVHCITDSIDWSDVIDGILDDWNIKKDKISCIILSASCEGLVKALREKEYVVVPCLNSVFQDCITACFENDVFLDLLIKVRIFITNVKSNQQMSEMLKLQEQLQDVEDSVLTHDYPSIWSSTVSMLSRLMESKNLFETVLFEADTGQTLSDADWELLQELVDVLEPFRMSLVTLSEEKIPSVSLIKPLLWQLKSVQLKENPKDSLCIAEIKITLKGILTMKFSEFEKCDKFLEIASVLDPRFTQLAYTEAAVKATTLVDIKNQIIDMINRKEGKDIGSSMHEKRVKLTGVAMLFSHLSSTRVSLTPEEKADIELTHFQGETVDVSDFSPLRWWSQVSTKCACLKKLSQRYTCAMAVAIPPRRLTTEKQIEYHTRRSMLKPQIVDMMLFLNTNYTFV